MDESVCFLKTHLFLSCLLSGKSVLTVSWMANPTLALTLLSSTAASQSWVVSSPLLPPFPYHTPPGEYSSSTWSAMRLVAEAMTSRS